MLVIFQKEILDSQRNAPPNFQLLKPKTFEATALQSDDSRKIDL